MLSFAAPWAAVALLLPLLLRWLLPPAPAPAALRLPIAAELLALQGAAEQQQRWRAPAICAVLAWVTLIAAAMQPQWLGEPVALPASGRDLMLAVDVSGSMDESDMRVGGRRLNRLQAVQALACGVEPHSDMNPVLLKPNSDIGAQVIVQGRALGNMDALDYHHYKGTARAAVRRLRKAGAIVEQAQFVIDLPDLGGADALRADGVQADALFAFEGH